MLKNCDGIPGLICSLTMSKTADFGMLLKSVVLIYSRV
jgi:hypothetical protein